MPVMPVIPLNFAHFRLPTHGNRYVKSSLKGYFSLNDSIRGQRETGKVRSNNYHQGNCGPSLTGKTSSVSLIFTYQAHRNVNSGPYVPAVYSLTSLISPTLSLTPSSEPPILQEMNQSPKFGLIPMR